VGFGEGLSFLAGDVDDLGFFATGDSIFSSILPSGLSFIVRSSESDRLLFRDSSGAVCSFRGLETIAVLETVGSSVSAMAFSGMVSGSSLNVSRAGS
jgi:hypothetical protein